MHFHKFVHAAELGHYDAIKRGAIKYRITCSNHSHFLIFQFVCEWSKLSVVRKDVSRIGKYFEDLSCLKMSYACTLTNIIQKITNVKFHYISM